MSLLGWHGDADLSPEAFAKALADFLRGYPGVLEWGVLPLTEPTPDLNHLQDWMQAGLHGPLGFMERHLDLRQDPLKMMPAAQSIVLISLAYPKPFVADGPQDRPKISSYAQGVDYHDRFRVLWTEFCQSLPENGPKIRPFADSAPVFERAWAKKAGLGWTGKNACLIHRKHGSGFFLGGALVELELPLWGMPQQDFCGSCTKCIDACPTQAIVSNGVVDARKCLSTWTIETGQPWPTEIVAAQAGWAFGCDVCQQVCPWNHKKKVAEHIGAPFDLSFEEWLRLLTKGGGFQSKAKGSPLLRAGRKKMLRNIGYWAHNQGTPEQKTLFAQVLVQESHNEPEFVDLHLIYGTKQP